VNRREVCVLLKLATEMQDGEKPIEYGTEADLAVLIGDGLIDGGGLVTEKGWAYILALEGVPLPVQRWCLPEDFGRSHRAIQEQQASEVHGGGGAQPGVREAGGDQAERGAGVQSRRRKQRPAQSSHEEGK
jgi:hypothetical protein